MNALDIEYEITKINSTNDIISGLTTRLGYVYCAACAVGLGIRGDAIWVNEVSGTESQPCEHCKDLILVG